MSVSKKLRFEVFKRDSFTCQYCGSTVREHLTFDHEQAPVEVEFVGHDLEFG